MRINAWVAVSLLCLACPATAQTTTTFDSILATGTVTVIGTATIQGTALSVGGATLFVSGGLVGIGTTTPHELLDLEGGNLRLQPTSSSAGIIYAGDLPFIHNYGSQNIFAGALSGNQSLTDGNNVGFGYSALKLNSSGGANSALGALALSHNTIGSSNTAVGFGALSINTEGLANTAVGTVAMFNNVHGISNTGIGMFALYNNLGDDNNAVGEAAMYTNASGSFNTAVGQTALGNMNNGDGNVALGYLALTDYTAGDDNIGIGPSAGSGGSSFTGNDNIFVGNSARASLDVNNSIAIGSDAEVSKNNAVAIGDHARASTLSSIVLGGTGLYSVNVGIGNASPAATLDVQMATYSAYALSISSANGTQMLSVDRKGVASIGNPSTSARLFGTALSVGGFGVYIGTADPVVRLDDQTQAANGRVWDMVSTGGQFVLRTMNDAGSAVSNAIVVSRTGNSVTQTTFDNGNVGIGTTAPATLLDVNGDSQFGTGADKSTFTAAGTLNLAVDAGLTLQGPTGDIIGQSSVTASAFFGNGSRLTGIPSTGSIVGVYVQKAGDTMTGALTINNAALNATGASGNIVSQSSITTTGAFFGDGGGITGLDASNLASGNVPAAVVSGNYPHITGLGTLTSALSINNVALTATGANGDIIGQSSIATSGAFFGNGGGITGLVASNLASGVVPSAVVSGNYPNITGLGTLTSALGINNVALTATGANGDIIGQSSITTSGAFFGDGSHLTGIPSTGSIVGVYVQKSGDAMSGALSVSGTSVTANAFFGDGSHLAGVVTAPGNNAFSGNNTHSGSETFNGGIIFGDNTIQTTAAIDSAWQSQVFTTSGVFTVPSQSSMVFVTLCGGGGGGGGAVLANNAGAGGGGGGGLTIQMYPISVAHSTYVYISAIGAKGIGGTGNNNGTTGGSTTVYFYDSFDGQFSTITALGGDGGQKGTNTLGGSGGGIPAIGLSGGLGGSGAGPAGTSAPFPWLASSGGAGAFFSASGGDGGYMFTTPGQAGGGGGGGGGGSPFGPGANGGAVNASGASAIKHCAGGGGAGYTNNASSRNGGNGSSGLVVFYWIGVP